MILTEDELDLKAVFEDASALDFEQAFDDATLASEAPGDEDDEETPEEPEDVAPDDDAAPPSAPLADGEEPDDEEEEGEQPDPGADPDSVSDDSEAPDDSEGDDLEGDDLEGDEETPDDESDFGDDEEGDEDFGDDEAEEKQSTFEVSDEKKNAVLYGDYQALHSLLTQTRETYLVGMRRVKEAKNEALLSALEVHDDAMRRSVKNLETVMDGSFETADYKKHLTIFAYTQTVAKLAADLLRG